MSRLLLKRLRAELTKPPGEARISRSDLRQLIELVERTFRVAVYVRHHEDCRLLAPDEKFWEARCSCGLIEARKVPKD